MKKIIYLIVCLVTICFALAQPLEIDDLIDVSYTGNALNSQFGNYGAIHFKSNGQWVGTLQIADSVYFEKGPAITGNLSIEFAGHPSALQTYSAGVITLYLNSTDGNYEFDVKVPDINANSNNINLYVDEYGSTYYDKALTNLARAWKEDECNPLLPSSYNDGSENTIDFCKLEGGAYVRKHIIPNIYGRVLDIDTNQPLEGANISFYDASLFEVDMIDSWDSFGNTSGDFEALVPKPIPDAVTDSNGVYVAYVPIHETHIVMQRSDEKKYSAYVRNDTTKIIIPEINGQTNINVTVTIESASAVLKSDIYILSPVTEKILFNSSVGTSWSAMFTAGEELKFAAEVDARPWKIKVDKVFDGAYNKNGAYSVYNHTSYGKYAQIDQLDYDTYRIYFEDLPENYSKTDWDFNDIVILIDFNTVPPQTNNLTINNSFDCDNDGIKNWFDYDDEHCDVGSHDSKIDEKPKLNVNFNAEGHILRSGRYNGENNYACGDEVKFKMFGVNRGDTNETITFSAEKNIAGNNDIEIYRGNISNPSESLFVPSGQKLEKNFIYKINCVNITQRTKHSLYVVWNDEKWHHIGNFFVVPRTVSPNLKIINDTDEEQKWLPREHLSAAHYFDKPLETVAFRIRLDPQANTMPALYLYPQDLRDYNCTVTDGVGETLFIRTDGIISFNGVNYSNELAIKVNNTKYPYGCYVRGLKFYYNESKYHTINVSVIDRYSLESPVLSVNVSSWASEQMVKDIWYDITQNNFTGTRTKPYNFTGFYNGDHCTRYYDYEQGGYCLDNVENHDVSTTLNGTFGFTATLDYWSGVLYSPVHFYGIEYRSEEDGLNPTVISDCYTQFAYYENSKPDVTTCERDHANMNWNTGGGSSSHNYLIIDPDIAEEVVKQIINYLNVVGLGS